MNKSRINCFLYMDTKMTASELPPRPRALVQRQTTVAHLSVEMNQCRLLHRNTQCTLSWDAWMEDHPADNTNMAQVYAQQTESEAEAEERLSGDEAWDTAVPASSQGM